MKGHGQDPDVIGYNLTSLPVSGKGDSHFTVGGHSFRWGKHGGREPLIYPFKLKKGDETLQHKRISLYLTAEDCN